MYTRTYTARAPLPRAPALAAEVGLYWCREARSRLPPHQGWVWVAGGGGSFAAFALQAELIAGARAVVGTLTSNFGLLLHDLAARQHNGSSTFVDLDNNSYYSCNVRVEPPWGPVRGRPSAVQDRLAMEAYRRAASTVQF